MNLFVYVSDPERYFSAGKDEWSLETSINVTTSKNMEEHGWVLIDEIFVDTNKVDLDMIKRKAAEKIEQDEQAEIAEHEVKMQAYEKRRSMLLALSYTPSSPPVDDDELPF